MSIQKMMEANARMNRMLQKQRQLSEQLNKINRVTKVFERQMAPLRKMEKVIANQKRLQTILKMNSRNVEFMRQQQNVISKYSEISNLLQSRLIQQYSDDALCHVLTGQESELTSTDVTIELNDVEVEESLVELKQVSSISDEASFLAWYDSKKPSIQLLITLVLNYWLSVFVNLSMPLYEDWGYIFQQENSRTAVKSVVREASKEFDLQYLEDYRFVIATSLHVRASASINSEVLDSLSNGKVVRFISKSKRWVKVEYLCPDTGDEQVGWVFARYLAKFEL